MFFVGYIQKIQVIASFNTKGQVLPLWVKIGSMTFKIESCVLKSTQVHIYNFSCEIIDESIKKTIRIAFNARDCLWYLCN